MKGKISLIMGLIFILFCSSFMPAQSDQDAKLKKQYADILGQWELDLVDAGMGMLPVEFYIDNGSFFVIPGDDPPLRMTLVEGEDWNFKVDDGDSIWTLEFSKAENGKYHKCKVINETEGIDTEGAKKKHP
jgi:hypothetical protein